MQLNRNCNLLWWLRDAIQGKVWKAQRNVIMIPNSFRRINLENFLLWRLGAGVGSRNRNEVKIKKQQLERERETGELIWISRQLSDGRGSGWEGSSSWKSSGKGTAGVSSHARHSKRKKRDDDDEEEMMAATSRRRRRRGADRGRKRPGSLTGVKRDCHCSSTVLDVERRVSLHVRFVAATSIVAGWPDWHGRITLSHAHGDGKGEQRRISPADRIRLGSGRLREETYGRQVSMRKKVPRRCRVFFFPFLFSVPLGLTLDRVPTSRRCGATAAAQEGKEKRRKEKNQKKVKRADAAAAATGDDQDDVRWGRDVARAPLKNHFPAQLSRGMYPTGRQKARRTPFSLSLSLATRKIVIADETERKDPARKCESRVNDARAHVAPRRAKLATFSFSKKKHFNWRGKKKKKTNTKFLYFILPWVFIPSRRDFNHFPELQISFLLLSCRTWRLCMYIKATWEEREREMLRRRRGDMSMATVRPFSGCGATAATVRYTGRCVTSSFWYTSRTCHLFHRMIIATTYSSLLPFW